MNELWDYTLYQWYFPNSGYLVLTIHPQKSVFEKYIGYDQLVTDLRVVQFGV